MPAIAQLRTVSWKCFPKQIFGIFSSNQVHFPCPTSLHGNGHIRLASSFSKQNEDVPIPPKKPLSIFLQFSLDKRKEIIRNNPGAKMLEISKLASQLWANISQSEKEVYQKQYDKRKAVYEVEYQDFILKLSDEQKQAIIDNRALKRLQLKEFREKKQHKKKLIELEMPRAPLQGYNIFVQENKEKLGGEKKKYFKKLAEMYNELSESEKKVYIDKGLENRKRYNAEMTDWVQRMLLEGHNDVVTKTQVKQMLDNLGRPHKPPSGFVMFVSEVVDKSTGKGSAGAPLKKAADQWKVMKETDKKKYMDQAFMAKEKYSQDLKDWEKQIEEAGMSEVVTNAIEFLKSERKPKKPKKKKPGRKKKLGRPKKRTTKKTKSKATSEKTTIAARKKKVAEQMVKTEQNVEKTKKTSKAGKEKTKEQDEWFDEEE